MTHLTNTREVDDGCIHVGLVNNMPDSAVEATERQFRTLLSEAADEILVRLSLYAVPEIPRSTDTRQRMESSYSSISTLWNKRLDGLIVTGAEPVTQKVIDEPFWGNLTRLMDWAEHNTHSSIWSCLAAQAAVLHIDNIERCPLGDKLFGVFECTNVSDHHLTCGIPARFWMPHSRWNEIPEHALSACGYRILTRLSTGIVDTFIKQRKSLFAFFQGHPEYEPTTLLYEYRRDIRRYLNREREWYPTLPQGYFDEQAAGALSALKTRALSDRRQDLFEHFPATIQSASFKINWHPQAVRFYRNWLRYLFDQRQESLQCRQEQPGYNFQSSLSVVAGTLAQEAEAG